MRGLTREQLERAVAESGPFRPELLAETSDEELAEAANSTGASFEELARNARKGGGGGDGVEVRGILADDPPSGDGETARNRGRGGDHLLAAGASLNGGGRLSTLATLNRRESDGRADNRDGGEADVEVTGILSGPRGQAVADGVEARTENAGRKRATEAGLRVTPILSGPRGTAAVDED